MRSGGNFGNGKKSGKITQKEKMLVDAWLSNGFNGAQAVLSVYKNVKNRNSASSLWCKTIHKDCVAEYREEMIRAIEEAGAATATEILISLSDIARDNKQRTKDRLKAFELLIKCKGMERRSIDITSGGQSVIIDDIEDDHEYETQ